MTSYEGLYLATKRARRGPRGAAHLGGDRLGGHAREHGRHRLARVQHGRRHALVPARARPARRGRPATTTSAPSSPRSSRRSSEHHVAGTRYGIGVDPADGLLRQGAEGWALTWMDARIDGVPVTPRAGKPVEVNALWIRALEVAASVARTDESRARTRRARGERARLVRERFVRPDGGGLFDVVDGPAGDDARVRPNQLLAVSLPNGRAGRRARRGRAVVDACRRSLLTPLGLRSLAPDDPALPAVPPRRARRARRAPTTRAPSGRG